ncbi:MAG TPA: FkbM family methyltransferase [Xanthobacteraceae bacterium]|nr:FkbM family methyltransferase [Xanthobacteraceae bacterium]
MRAMFPPDVEDELKEAFFAGAGAGYFVEVGANDPQYLSQTWHLERRGWTGVLVEPQPDLAAELVRRRSAKVYPVACSSPRHSGRAMTLHLAGIHSSFDPDLNISTERAEGTVEVPVRTLDEILVDAGAPAPIDFLSIDVEGHEIEALDGFDFARWRPRLILIEDLAMNLDVHRCLTAHGYKWMRRTGLNSWYVPGDAAVEVGLFGRWQFLRKHYLGVPFRHFREASRRFRHGTWWGRRRAAAK